MGVVDTVGETWVETDAIKSTTSPCGLRGHGRRERDEMASWAQLGGVMGAIRWLHGRN